MNTQTPNRNGWMTGARSDTLACPPFPDFTDFERQALESIALSFGDLADAFRAQLAVSEVVDRINTIVGFYTRVKVDRAKCSPLPLRNRDAHFEAEGIENGVGIVLWDTDGDGYLETIEGWTAGDDPLKGIDLAKLKFIRLAQFG